MSTEFFCCSDVHPLDEYAAHDVHKIEGFVKWAKKTLPGPYETKPCDAPFIIELQQSDFSSTPPPRYFIPTQHLLNHYKFEEIPTGLVRTSFQPVASSRLHLECEHHYMYFSINRYERNHVNAHPRDSFNLSQFRLGRVRQLLGRGHSSSATSSTTHGIGLSTLGALSHLHSSSGNSSFLPPLSGISSRFSDFGDFDTNNPDAVSSNTTIDTDADTDSNNAQADTDGDLPTEPVDTSSDSTEGPTSPPSNPTDACCEPDQDGSDDVAPSNDYDEIEGDEIDQQGNEDIEDTGCFVSESCYDDCDSYGGGDDFCSNDCDGCDFSDDF